MQKKSVHKYCHVNAYVAYEEDSPIYKKSFKFKLKPSGNHNGIWQAASIKIEKKWNRSGA